MIGRFFRNALRKFNESSIEFCEFWMRLDRQIGRGLHKIVVTCSNFIFQRPFASLMGGHLGLSIGLALLVSQSTSAPIIGFLSSIAAIFPPVTLPLTIILGAALVIGTTVLGAQIGRVVDKAFDAVSNWLTRGESSPAPTPANVLDYVVDIRKRSRADNVSRALQDAPAATPPAATPVDPKDLLVPIEKLPVAQTVSVAPFSIVAAPPRPEQTNRIKSAVTSAVTSVVGFLTPPFRP